MSRCSGLALFSSSSFTTSMWPSLAAEISAVQQSCAYKQTITPGSVLESHTPGGSPVQLRKKRSLWTYQLTVPGAHGKAMKHGCTAQNIQCQRVWRTTGGKVPTAAPVSLCNKWVVCAACNSRSHINEIIMRGVECKHARVRGLRAWVCAYVGNA